MYDGVDATCSDHPRDNGIADVGAYEIGGAQVVPRRDHIDPDDLNVCLSGKRAGEAGPQVTRDSGDEDDPFRGHQGAQAWRLLTCATALDSCPLQQLAMLLL